jgi:hypothetical protein
LFYVASDSPEKTRGRLTPAEVRSAIHRICKEKNYDPFTDLIELAVEETDVVVDGKPIRVRTATVDQRITIAKELAQYLAPKLKSIEVSGEIDNEWRISVTHFGQGGNTQVAAPEAAKEIMTSALKESQKLIQEAVTEEVGDDENNT